MPDSKWKKHYERIIDILTSKYPPSFKRILLNYDLSWLKFLGYPFYLLLKLFLLLLPRNHSNDESGSHKEG
jgi:hypothetical protein